MRRIELRRYDASVTEISRREPTVSAETAEKNKALVHRFLKAHARGDLDELGEMLAHDFVDHSLLPGQVPGREGYIQSAAEQHAALSDIRYIIEYQSTDGDMVKAPHDARHPRPRATIWRSANRQAMVHPAHCHQSRLRGQDRRRVERGHRYPVPGGDRATGARARARRARPQGSAAHSASLAP